MYFIILRDGLGVRHSVRLRRFVALGNHQHHEAHVSFSLLIRRTTVLQIDRNQSEISHALTPTFNGRFRAGTAVAAVLAMAFSLRQPRPWHLRAAAIVGLVFLAVFGWFVIDLVGAVPSKKELRAFSDMASANILFDAADREVFTIAKEHRIEVPLAEISPNLIKAVIAIEDRRFFDHEGFDPIRIIGSAIAVARAGEAVQGGSTITQQLARQSVGREKTLSRKLRELLFAAAARASLHEGRDPRALSEQGLFRQRPLRRRSRVARLLRQEGVAVVARRSVAARRSAEGAVELRPVAGAAEGRSAADRRVEGDAREQGHHARRNTTRRSRRRSKSTTACAPRSRTASTSRTKCAASSSSSSATSASSRAG